MLNKNQIIKTLQKYNFDKNEYIVLSGAALTIHNIKKETPDIDIAVSKKLYNELLKNYNCHQKPNETEVYSLGVLEFGLNYFDRNNIDYIQNIPVQNISSIIKLKQSLNREKDQKDIKLIKEFMKNNDR